MLIASLCSVSAVCMYAVHYGLSLTRIPSVEYLSQMMSSNGIANHFYAFGPVEPKFGVSTIGDVPRIE
jgi:hypothetical protein